jgi:hypothetical protein
MAKPRPVRPGLAGVGVGDTLRERRPRFYGAAPRRHTQPLTRRGTLATYRRVRQAVAGAGLCPPCAGCSFPPQPRPQRRGFLIGAAMPRWPPALANWPGLCADRSADGADHARAKGPHRQLVGIAARVEQGFLMAASSAAINRDAANAVGAHVAERHGGSAALRIAVTDFFRGAKALDFRSFLRCCWCVWTCALWRTSRLRRPAAESPQLGPAYAFAGRASIVWTAVISTSRKRCCVQGPN